MRRLITLLCLFLLVAATAIPAQADIYTDHLIGRFSSTSGAVIGDYRFFPGDIFDINLSYALTNKVSTEQGPTGTTYTFKHNTLPALSLSGRPMFPDIPAELLGSIIMGSQALGSSIFADPSRITVTAAKNGDFALQFSFTPYYWGDGYYDSTTGRNGISILGHKTILDLSYNKAHNIGSFSIATDDYLYFLPNGASGINSLQELAHTKTGSGSGWVSGLTTTVTHSPVPIPGAVWLLGAGLAGLVGVRKRFA